MTITLTREEAQQVLDVIERNIVGVPRYRATELLRARLAQPEPDNMAGYRLACSYGVFESRAFDLADKFRELYTAPPQREWQGLTSEEMFDCLVQVDGETKRLPLGFVWFASALEAKLKQKNA